MPCQALTSKKVHFHDLLGNAFNSVRVPLHLALFLVIDFVPNIVRMYNTFKHKHHQSQHSAIKLKFF